MTAINLIYNNRDSRWRGNGVGMLLLLRRQWDSVYSKCLMPPLYKKWLYSIPRRGISVAFVEFEYF